jgi:hypothetical protein
MKENMMLLNSNKWRISLLIFSPLFLLMVGYFIVNQQKIIGSIVNKYFSLTFTNVLQLLATDNWMEVLLLNAESMAINIGVVLLIEIIAAVIALIVIFFFIYRIWKREAFYFGNKLVFSGYILIVIGMSIVGTIALSSAIITYTTVRGILNELQPSELQALSNEILTILANFSLASNQIFKDLVSVSDQLELVFARAGEVASIPDIIHSWWQGILSLRIYGVSVAVISVLSILTGHVMEVWTYIKASNLYQNRKVKTRKESFNERLLRVLEKQNEIIELMNKKDKLPG